MKYSKRTVNEAVQLLDVYASQEQWEGGDWDTLYGVAASVGVTVTARDLAALAHGLCPYRSCQIDALEAAQRLREGWLPWLP